MLKTADNSCSLQDQDSCIESIIEDQLKKSIGCRPYWINLNLPNCSDMEIFKIADEEARTVLQSIDQLCPKPCRNLEIKTWAKNFETNSHNILYIYFPFKVASHAEHFLVSPLALIAEMGGNAGLMLGVSFYHVIQLISFVIDIQITKLTKDEVFEFKE